MIWPNTGSTIALRRGSFGQRQGGRSERRIVFGGAPVLNLRGLGIALLELNVHRRSHAIENERWIVEGCQVYKMYAIRKLLEQVRSNLDCEPRLSATA